MMVISKGYAQSRIITGIVKDNSSKPMDGVTVVVVETQKVVFTDATGVFKVSAANGQTIRFTYIGLKTINIVVTSDIKDLQVQFKDSESNSLNEVVVTGYTAERKKDLTGAVSVVNIKDIKNVPSSSPLLALQGHVPGLYISTDGSPTGANNRQILIRGVNSLGDASPLYIIDGVPTTRYEAFSSLNSNSIASIQVLKDASAASIYGSRASNGVIIVTTIDGHSAKDKVNISLNTSYTAQTLNPWETPVLNAQQRAQALWRAAVNDGTDPNLTLPNIYTYNWNNDYKNPVLNQVNINPLVGGSASEPVGDTNWQKALYKTAYISANDLTIASGNGKSGMLLDFGYYNNTGLIDFTGYKRYNGRINAHTSAFDGKLRIGENLLVSHSSEVTAVRDVGGVSTPNLALTLAPTIPLYKADGSYGGPIGPGYSDRNNPVDMQFLNKDNTHQQLIGFGNAYAEIEPIKRLVFRTSIGFDYADDMTRTILLVGNEGPVRSVNSLALQQGKELTTTWTNTVTYNYEFGKSKLNFLGGTEAIKDDYQTFGAYRENFALTDPSYFQFDAGSGTINNNGSATGFRLLSQFAKINYSYTGKYLLSATIRRDGSSRFGSNNPYGFFPAVTAGWRINQEDFMKNISQISNLKLRAGVGRVGNQQIGNLASYGLLKANYGTIAAPLGVFPGGWLNTGTAYDLNGANTGTLPSGYVQIQAANPDLKWESTDEINAGIDFGLFNDKITGTFDYFSRNTSNILIQPPVAGAVGEGQLQYVNGASKSNKGWEFTLSYANHTDGGLNYMISANAGHFHDEITALPASVRAAYPGDINHPIIGHSQYSFFGYKTDGIFQSQAQVNSSPTQAGAAPGRIKYADLNGDGKIDVNDQDFLGTSLPGLEYGLNITLNYKQFDLSIFGSGVASKKVFDNSKFFGSFIDVRNNFGPGVLNAWTPQNTGSKTPALSLLNLNNEDRTSDFYIVNGDYFKIRNIQIGYSLPKSIASRFKIENIRFYLLGQNLAIFKSKDYSGKDPEVGGNVDNVPIPTSVTFGLNVTF
ncbi:SusC/RagA family TonB-linked outer membrane protein [Mucilaginibacter sp. PPCGB 2223]|uniref:SusC/RagA family TonB-linked outer membrane protein n=1 Tax=Mucilaginibacter sp. PPCGB 2223 TaxID=1886027 RepID=UPI000AC2FCD1|nr:SusC/RagA family TonB-linked outer membrane protein [Mucilaginibacter sp. PPCGB 2223]